MAHTCGLDVVARTFRTTVYHMAMITTQHKTPKITYSDVSKNNLKNISTVKVFTQGTTSVKNVLSSESYLKWKIYLEIKSILFFMNHVIDLVMSSHQQSKNNMTILEQLLMLQPQLHKHLNLLDNQQDLVEIYLLQEALPHE
jgi:hypothetical protein